MTPKTYRLSPPAFLDQTFSSRLDAQRQAVRHLLSLGYDLSQIEHDERDEDFVRVTAGFGMVQVISSDFDAWSEQL